MATKKFGNKAGKLFNSEKKKIGSLGDFLSDKKENTDIRENGNTESGKTENTENSKLGKQILQNNENTELRKSVVKPPEPEHSENQETGESLPAPPVMVRHELHLNEELSEKIRHFQFFNKENNKTRLIRIMIEDFFSKPEEQQREIWKKWHAKE